MLRCRDRTEPTLTATIRTTSHSRRWTYADYCKIPPDRYRHELIDGRHFVSPAPSSYHQKLSLRLAGEFLERVERPGLGEVFAAPFDVHLARGTVVQPDLVVVTKKNRSLVGEAKLAGVPDLLVEILSPSRRDYDCRIKRKKYERAGVRELWIVDPEVPCIEQYVMRAGTYGRAVVCTESIRLRVLRGVEFVLKRIW